MPQLVRLSCARHTDRLASPALSDASDDVAEILEAFANHDPTCRTRGIPYVPPYPMRKEPRPLPRLTDEEVEAYMKWRCRYWDGDDRIPDGQVPKYDDDPDSPPDGQVPDYHLWDDGDEQQSQSGGSPVPRHAQQHYITTTIEAPAAGGNTCGTLSTAAETAENSVELSPVEEKVAMEEDNSTEDEWEDVSEEVSEWQAPAPPDLQHLYRRRQEPPVMSLLSTTKSLNYSS